MHEMSLAEGMVQILEDNAKTQNFKKVLCVWLEIGQLSHVDPEAITFCFEAVTKGTLAEGAKLEILRPPGQAWCDDCVEQVEIADRVNGCPKCGGHRLIVTDGEDMRVKELEVE